MNTMKQGALSKRGFFVFLVGVEAELGHSFPPSRVSITALQFSVLRISIGVVVVKLLKVQVNSGNN
jgi:hypothetical protein